MTNPSESQSSLDDGVDRVAIAEYDAMVVPIQEFLRQHEDVRITLARQRCRGGWYVLLNSTVVAATVHAILPKDATVEQMIAQVGLLYGRLKHAKPTKAKVVKSDNNDWDW